jgi:hypothetical protein
MIPSPATVLSTLILISGFGTLGIDAYDLWMNGRPKADRYADVNSDGIQDKIVSIPVNKSILLGVGTYKTYQDQTLYGINLKDKTIYLPREQFEEARR